MSLTIPLNAPFNGAQKMWLKGFLDGISSAFPPPSGHIPAQLISRKAPTGTPVTVLWGSQTGNSEGLGKKLCKTLAAKGHSPTLRDMAEISPSDLLAWEKVLIITSTYGDGEPPDNAAALHSALASQDAPQLVSLRFAVLALGDSNYPDFCKCGHDFHARLTALGAEPLLPVTEADVDYDTPFADWARKLESCLSESATALSS